MFRKHCEASSVARKRLSLVIPRSPCPVEAVNVLLPGQVHGAQSLLNNTPMEYKLLVLRGQVGSSIAGRLSRVLRLDHSVSSVRFRAKCA